MPKSRPPGFPLLHQILQHHATHQIFSKLAFSFVRLLLDNAGIISLDPHQLRPALSELHSFYACARFFLLFSFLFSWFCLFILGLYTVREYKRWLFPFVIFSPSGYARSHVCMRRARKKNALHVCLTTSSLSLSYPDAHFPMLCLTNHLDGIDKSPLHLQGEQLL